MSGLRMVTSLMNRNIDEIREVLADLEELQDSLAKRFNRPLFRRVRRLTGTQAEWAQLTNVTQTTIGNWERGFTVPNRYYRNSLYRSCELIKGQLAEIANRSQFELGRRIDPVRTSRNLDRSILRAALTDFDYDAAARRIIPVPFSGDFDDDLAAEIAEDRSNLLESLKKQAEFICESISDGANLNERKLVNLLRQYSEEVASSSPNPRLLNRFGSTISRAANGDDFRGAANDIDLDSIDGFNRDHLELMRLYFKEALSKAQELDGSEVIDAGEISDVEFRGIAEIMERAQTDSGEAFVEASIPTLLKDIATEIRDLDDAITLTSDERRAEILVTSTEVV